MGALFLTMIPLTIFMLFVAPIWLWLHYSQRKNNAQLSQDDIQHLVRLTEDANRMRERIAALEEILDAEHPSWRQS
ncbi:envelope stress response membrane protein PspB [Pectobacteriaceae bacterium CE70]|uniref:Envelope stress response membrane protein PspB n=1 Tax=Serratia sp. (strain ATCC 39006) TaxID=104623 RepID=A0A2I5T7J6_SERS3|nr:MULTISPECIES: envelope stress response membrane protein PspB [Enterobacterales]WJV56364.1 envelope stress response membrane protein PspB [Pectobacteriaceae bacterium C111]WJV60776.1 envelope stress response membrane protein PspB [Pectobacteriaceae bacterium C52]WJV68781.1 envelope stress response membrane protein PspB [Pectobacteriaceae bacterium CE70]WJY12705.1 envelope stress response membrane protein PspB [Pectobacteriaceae bacterium C80]WJY16838.1 envelope stress response membrane prote